MGHNSRTTILMEKKKCVHQISLITRKPMGLLIFHAYSTYQISRSYLKPFLTIPKRNGCTDPRTDHRQAQTNMPPQKNSSVKDGVLPAQGLKNVYIKSASSRENLTLQILTTLDLNWPAQLQRQARVLKFWI